MPVYVDSPLATKCTEIFAQHSQVYDEDLRGLIDKGVNPFHFPGLHFTHSVEDSIALNDNRNPMIIIAASGMCEAGRILHHLRNNIDNPKNTILIVSFQAEHTLGRRIADRVEEVNIFGEPHKLKARVKILNSFSGHAGRSDLLDYVKKVAANSPRLKKIFVVHGEPAESLPFIETIKTYGHFECYYPKHGEKFVL
jgi:metallo-beta-lactamase family protein